MSPARLSPLCFVLLSLGVLAAGCLEVREDPKLSAPASHPAALTANWASAGALQVSRAFHTTTSLQGGEVLVAGGVHVASSGSRELSEAELYEPSSGTWSVV